MTSQDTLHIELRQLRLLREADCLLELNPQLIVKSHQDAVYCFHPSGATVVFSRQQGAYATILDALASGPKLGAEVLATGGNSANQLPVDVVLDLLAKDVIRVLRNPSSAKLDVTDVERFRSQLHFFGSYESVESDRFDMQLALHRSRVAIVGVGGLGSLVAFLLCSTGVRGLTLIDGDKIEIENLPRQILYDEQHVGLPKVDVLAERLMRHDTRARIVARNCFLDSLDATVSLTEGHDFIMLCADQPSVQINYWIGEASLRNRIPYMAMARTWVGPISVPYVSPCYVCQTRHHRNRIPNFETYLNSAIDARSPFRPSFAPGPCSTSALIATGIVEFLAGIDPTRLMFSRFSVDIHGNSQSETFVKFADCPKCGRGSIS